MSREEKRFKQQLHGPVTGQAGMFATYSVGFTVGDPEPVLQDHQNVVHESSILSGINVVRGMEADWVSILFCATCELLV
jgi:hypothetical protein